MEQIQANEEGFFSSGFRESSDVRLSYLGPFRNAYAGYAADASKRQKAASGGVASALIKFALERKIIDGAVLARSDFSKQKLDYEIKIVTSPREVDDFASSAYFNIPLEKYASEIAAFKGRLAICALPCHTSILRSRMEKDARFRNVKLLISLFCGHNNERELFPFVLRKSKIPESEICSMKVDRGYLGGNVRFLMRDGKERLLPFRDFNVYRSLGLFGKAMCRYCDDHLGALSDISIGDIFIPPYRGNPIKHSAVLVRTQAGEDLFSGAMRERTIICEKIDPLSIFQAQKRILVPSRDLKSRYYACKLAGYPVKETGMKEATFRLRSFLTYFLLLANNRLSQTGWGRRFFLLIPRPLLYFYIAFIKLLNNTLGCKNRDE